MPKYQIAFPPPPDKFIEKSTDSSGSDSYALTSGWQNYFRSFHTSLSNNFNEHGTSMPPLKNGELAAQENGVTYYNSDDNQLETIVNGVIHVVTTTPK